MLSGMVNRLIPSLFIFVFASFAATPLRIASFNLEWLTASVNENDRAPWPNEAALEKHRKGLAHILAAEVHADVVCVLESTSRVALEKLNAEPELKPLHYRVYHLESKDDALGQDVAFMVRIPLDRVSGKEVNDFRNESHDPLTKRAVIFLTVGKLKIGLLGMHLLAHPDDAKRNRKRRAQAMAATRIIRDEIVSRGYAPIVLGDLNDFDPDVKTESNNFPRDKVLHILKDFDRKKPGDELINAAGHIEPMSERYSAY